MALLSLLGVALLYLFTAPGIFNGYGTLECNFVSETAWICKGVLSRATKKAATDPARLQAAAWGCGNK